MLRNRKDNEQTKLTGVNRVADPGKIQLGTFESLQNWIPAKRYKIKKKRGVAQLIDTPPAPIIPSNCGHCVTAFPAAQTLPFVCCYSVDSGYGNVSSNHCGTLTHVDTDGSFWFTVSENTGSFTTPYPPNLSTDYWYLLLGQADCTLTNISSSAVDFAGHTSNFTPATASSGVDGKSDEKSYLLSFGSLSPHLTIGGHDVGAAGAYFGTSTGVSFLNTDLFGSVNSIAFACPWVKHGSYLYGPAESGGNRYICRWPIPSPTGTFQDQQALMSTVFTGWNDTAPIDNLTFNTYLRDMHATDNYLYVLGVGDGSYAFTNAPTTGTRIIRGNKDFSSSSTFWSLTGDWAATRNIFAFSDDLIFLFYRDSTIDVKWHFGFLKTSDGSVTEIGSLGAVCTPAGNDTGIAQSGQTGFYYTNNYFYLSYVGFGFGLTNVAKVGPLLCPGSTDILWES